jgi:hypothetical protein
MVVLPVSFVIAKNNQRLRALINKPQKSYTEVRAVLLNTLFTPCSLYSSFSPKTSRASLLFVSVLL